MRQIDYFRFALWIKYALELVGPFLKRFMFEQVRFKVVTALTELVN